MTLSLPLPARVASLAAGHVQNPRADWQTEKVNQVGNFPAVSLCRE